jgi:ATP-binding cassette subfamily B protein
MLRGEARLAGCLIAGAGLEACFALATPWISARAIDAVLPLRQPSLLVVCAVLILAVGVHGAAAGWWHDRILIGLRRRIEAISLDQVLRALMKCSLRQLDAKGYGATSEMMRAVSQGALDLTTASASALTQALSASITFVLLAFWNATVAALVLVGGLSMAVLALAAAREEAKRSLTTLDITSRQQQLLHVLLRASAALRAAGATSRATALWRGLLARQAHASVAQLQPQLLQGVARDAIPQFVTLIVLVWLVQDVLAGRATLGHMMMTQMFVATMLRSLAAVVGTVASFQSLGPRLALADEVLGHSSEARDPPRAAPALAPSGILSFEDVWFRYDDDGDWLLKGHTERFPAGTFSRMHAASGSGKTTKARLLAGLLEPQRGAVLVNGQRASEARRFVTYLPQQTALVEGSIAANLALFSERSQAAVHDVAKRTGLARWLERLPMQGDTWVSSGGGNLSAGQRQLILLTAAFASARPIILLDEPVSQLDPVTRQLIDWTALLDGRTVILIEHEESAPPA